MVYRRGLEAERRRSLSLAKAGEDHLEPLFPKALRDLLGAPVMAAQAGLGDEDTHLQFSFHGVYLLAIFPVRRR